MADTERDSNSGDDSLDAEDLVENGWCPYKDTMEDSLRLVRNLSKLFDGGDRWCKGHMAVTADGAEAYGVHDNDVCAWCLSGGIAKLTGIEGDRLEWAVEFYQWPKPDRFFQCLDEAIHEYSNGQCGLWTDNDYRRWPDLLNPDMDDASSNHTLEFFNDRASGYDDIENVLILTERKLKEAQHYDKDA